eukprot:168478-Chlamydomonas_euryale.AAC.1
MRGPRSAKGISNLDIVYRICQFWTRHQRNGISNGIPPPPHPAHAPPVHTPPRAHTAPAGGGGAPKDACRRRGAAPAGRKRVGGAQGQGGVDRGGSGVQ